MLARNYASVSLLMIFSADEAAGLGIHGKNSFHLPWVFDAADKRVVHAIMRCAIWLMEH